MVGLFSKEYTMGCLYYDILFVLGRTMMSFGRNKEVIRWPCVGE